MQLQKLALKEEEILNSINLNLLVVLVLVAKILQQMHQYLKMNHQKKLSQEHLVEHLVY
jgi:hypothetical protein